MKSYESDLGALEDAIACDEVGLSFGILGAFRLKTVYRPVLARRGEALEPVALAAAVSLEQHGRTATEQAAAAIPAADRLLAERLGNVLAIRNLAHSDSEDAPFELLVALPEGVPKPSAEAALLLRQASAHDVAAERLCFDLSRAGGEHDLAAAAEAIVSANASVALDLDAMSRMGSRLPSGLRPALVRVPPAWTRGIVDEPGLLRVFKLLVASLAGRDICVQVEGISDAAQLRAALAAGAGRFQGDHIAIARLAGMDYDPAPRPLAELLGARDNVIPLTA